MSGFFAVERDIWDHPIFTPGPMTEREAWMWMLAKAAYKDTRHRVGSELVGVPRGSFMATLREMQSAFMWGSDKRVRTFLKTLEKEGMIGRTTVGARNAPKTHVTICNYERYQSRGRTKDAPETHERTHRGRTTDAVKKQGNKGTKDTNVSLDAECADILSECVERSEAENFVAFRRELKKPMTARSARAMVKQLSGHHAPAEVLNASISNGWQGIFPDRVKPQSQFTAINGGNHERPNRSNPTQRPDPALENILRIAGVGEAQGNSGR